MPGALGIHATALLGIFLARVGPREASLQTDHCPCGGFCLVSNSQSPMTKAALSCLVTQWPACVIVRFCTVLIMPYVAQD